MVVFAAVGRSSHGEADDLLGLVGTAAPFGVGLVAAWATPLVRRRPAGVARRAVVAGRVPRASACSCALAFLDRLPLSFAVSRRCSLAVLLLGWRGLAALVSKTAHRAAR